MDARVLFRIGFNAWATIGLKTKEESEAYERLVTRLSDAQFEHDTGLPAIARTMPSADQM